MAGVPNKLTSQEQKGQEQSQVLIEKDAQRGDSG